MDQISAQKKIEKNQFIDIFNDYMSLMDDY